MSKTIRNKKAALRMLTADDEQQAKRNLYKATACGAWIEFDKDGVRVGSIVEGCDFGTAVYPLKYPFTEKDFDDRMEAIEKEAEALWEWANAEEGGASDGAEAPDVSTEFEHLGPNGRSG